jgi:hypothetical protein
MNYYIDTEYLNGIQKKKILGLTYGQTKPFIDLISIGIVAEDGREYYAISKDFNLREAWDKYQLSQDGHTEYNPDGSVKWSATSLNKVYWIRENLLKPMFIELWTKEYMDNGKSLCDKVTSIGNHKLFTSALVEDFWGHISDKNKYKKLKYLINKYGKTNKQIAEEIKGFIYSQGFLKENEDINNLHKDKFNIEFYAYFGAFDYVVFSQLFGGFENYPKGFPQYFIDLKQMVDEKAVKIPVAYNLELGIKTIELSEDYPKKPITHHALSDAHWNKQLHEFLKSF